MKSIETILSKKAANLLEVNRLKNETIKDILELKGINEKTLDMLLLPLINELSQSYRELDQKDDLIEDLKSDIEDLDIQIEDLKTENTGAGSLGQKVFDHLESCGLIDAYDTYTGESVEDLLNEHGIQYSDNTHITPHTFVTVGVAGDVPLTLPDDINEFLIKLKGKY